MAGKRRIEITIAPDGTASVETRGWKGRSCLDAGKAIADALGATIADTKTSEYFQAAESAEQHERTGQ
jgi:hypothetical protein